MKDEKNDFNIEDYKFEYLSFYHEVDEQGEIEIWNLDEVRDYITRRDAIALAKHFKVTPEEINEPLRLEDFN